MMKTKKSTCILQGNDVEEGEVIIALLWKPKKEAEAHLVRFDPMWKFKSSKQMKKMLIGDLWKEIGETFLSQVGKR